MNQTPVLIDDDARTLIAGELLARSITEDRRATGYVEMMMGEIPIRRARSHRDYVVSAQYGAGTAARSPPVRCA